jgi:hypothetical protein
VKEFRISALETQIMNSALDNSRDIAKLKQELYEMETREISVQVRNSVRACLVRTESSYNLLSEIK